MTKLNEATPMLNDTEPRPRQNSAWFLDGWRAWLADASLIALAFFVSYHMRYTFQLFQSVDEANSAPFGPYIPYTFIFMLWILLANQSAGLYAQRRGRTWANELFTLGNAATNAGLVIMALSFLFRPLVFSRLLIVQAVALTIVLLAIWRIVVREIRHNLRRRGIGMENALIVGADELGMSVLRTVVSRPDLGYKAIGFLDDDPDRNSSDLGRVEALGAIDNLRTILKDKPIDLVIITLPWERHSTIVNIIKLCDKYGVAVRTVPDLFQLNLSQTEMEFLGGIPLLGMHKRVQFHRANHIIKRTVDIVLTLLALPLILPIIGLIALAIRLETSGSPFFSHERVGMNGRKFQIIKFRSMIQNAEDMWEDVMKQTNEDLRRPKLVDDPRVTRVGKFIRRTSLDELPNIFNVLKGDMSLIGPRPQVTREVELYAPWQYQRLKVRPGMTGLWQVSGRSEVPFDEMCLMDIYYIENWSLALDLQILLQTAPRVVFRIGAY